MADAEEDFSFPATTANPPPCFFESPPLWQHVTRLGNSENLMYGEKGHERKFKLCSCEEFKAKNINVPQRKSPFYLDIDCDEKMDSLWEDLNEKISRNCGKMAEESDNSSPGRAVRVCCVKAPLKLSKANGNTISWRKVSILVLIRLLMKKGFTMHNSGSSFKKLDAW